MQPLDYEVKNRFPHAISWFQAFALTCNLYGRYVEEDAHSAEERAAALDKNAGEHEGQHRALEHMVQKLQKKLDVCVNDRGVLSGELGSATRKAAGAGHLELLNRQCEEETKVQVERARPQPVTDSRNRRMRALNTAF